MLIMIKFFQPLQSKENIPDTKKVNQYVIYEKIKIAVILFVKSYQGNSGRGSIDMEYS